MEWSVLLSVRKDILNTLMKTLQKDIAFNVVIIAKHV